MISEGRVSVNGSIAVLGTKIKKEDTHVESGKYSIIEIEECHLYLRLKIVKTQPKVSQETITQILQLAQCFFL